MLRILQITEAASAGVGRHVIDLVEGLDASGCQMHVIYAPGRMDDTFADRLARLPVASAQIDMQRGPHVGDTNAWRCLRRYLKQHGPFDIIHAHSTKAGLLARMLPRRGAKIVYTPHCIYTMNPTASRLAYWGVRVLERMYARWTNAIIAVSPDEQRHIVELGIRSDKVRCVVNGVQPIARGDTFAARAARGLPAEGVLVGFLGRLSGQKDPVNFIEACAEVIDRGRNIHAVVAGTGQLESVCRRRAAALGIDHRVHWLGYQTAAELMPAIDLFAMSSRYEGMPYTLLESLAAGLPVVTTDVGGARLAVENGGNGYVVPVQDTRALADRIDQLAGNPTLRAEFAAASLRRASRFTVEQMVRQTLDLYQELVRRAATRAAGAPVPANFGSTTRVEPADRPLVSNELVSR